MKKSTLRRLVALAVAVCLLVGLSPLLKSITGLADENAAFIVRVNGNEQQSGNTFEEVITKAAPTSITSITMIAGEVSENEFSYLVANGLHTNLNSLTVVTPPPSIDTTKAAELFKDFPTNRTLFVPATSIAAYKVVNDGVVDDNFWYGWNLMEATPQPIVPTSTLQEIQNPLPLTIEAPAEGKDPQTTLDVGTGYMSSEIVWKNGTELHTGAFAAKSIYTAEVTLTSVEGFKFAPNASVSVSTGTVTSCIAAGADESSNTVSFTVTFPNTTAGDLMPPSNTVTPPDDTDTVIPPADDSTGTPPVDDSTGTPPVDDSTGTPPVDDSTGTPPVDDSTGTPPAKEEWKPTIMGGFSNQAPKADTPSLLASVPGVPESSPEALTATITPAPNSGTEIDDYFGIIPSIVGKSGPIDPGVKTEEAPYRENDPITGNPVDKMGAKTTTVVYDEPVYEYAYTWEETVVAPVTPISPSPKIEGKASSRENIPHFPNKTLTKANLGDHKFKFKVTEKATITGNVVVKYNPPESDPAYNPITNNTGEYKTPFDVSTTKNAAATDADTKVTKMTPKITISKPQPSPNANEDVNVSATVTGKNGELLFDPDLSLSDNAKPTPYTAYVQFTTAGATADQGVAIGNRFDATLTLRNETMYTIKARYTGDANYLPVETELNYDHKILPTTITSNHIGVISIPSPVAGVEVTSGADVELPKVPNTDGIHYGLDLKWYAVNRTIANADFTDFSNDSLVTNRFYEGKRHKAVITLKANQKYTFAPNTIATFQALGAVVSPPKYIDSITDTRFNSENSIQYVILFPSTMSKDTLAQKSFGFNNYSVPLTKTYGDPDFLLQAYGGNGNGNITYESSDPNVLRIMANPNGTASIKIVGSGKATISAKKAGSLEGDNDVWYEPVSATTAEIVVSPKMLTATVDNKTIKVGSRTTAFKVRVRGFVNGDTEDNLSGYVAPIAMADVEDVPELGTYDIKVSGGEAKPKYTFKYVHGVLTVNETGIPPTTSTTTNTVIAGGNSAYIHEPRNDVTLTRKDAQYFENGVEMTVDNKTSTISVAISDVINRNINAALTGKSIADIYDISLSLDNENYALNTDVTTQLRITNAIKNKFTDLGVVHVDNAGNITPIPSSITSNGEYITFTTNYVGSFAIVGKLRVASTGTTPPPTTSNPQTGDSTPLFPFVVAILLGGTFIVLGSRKEELI